MSGNLLWVRGIGSSAPDYVKAITLDAGGNVYATGSFYLTADFDPGPGFYNLTSSGQEDAFVLKLDPQGDFLWAKAFGGPLKDYGTSLTLDATLSVYIIGAFENVADLDPGSGIVNLTSLGDDDIFVLKLSRCSNSSFNIINASVCNSYILNSQTYDSSGVYTQIILNSAGCDSVITLN